MTYFLLRYLHRSRHDNEIRHTRHRQRHRRCRRPGRRDVPLPPRHAQRLDDADRRRCRAVALRSDAAGTGEQRRLRSQHLRRCGSAGSACRLSRQGGERPVGHRIPPRHDGHRRAFPVVAAVRWSANGTLPDPGDPRWAAHHAHLSWRMRQPYAASISMLPVSGAAAPNICGAEGYRPRISFSSPSFSWP